MKTAPKCIEPRLPVTDLKASIDFYRGLLDFESKDTVFEHDGFAILQKEKVGIQLVTHSKAHPLSQNTIWIDFIGVAPLHENIKDRFTIEWGQKFILTEGVNSPSLIQMDTESYFQNPLLTQYLVKAKKAERQRASFDRSVEVSRCGTSPMGRGLGVSF